MQDGQAVEFSTQAGRAVEVVIALGSNQADPLHQLTSAIQLLPQYGVRVQQHSLLYETAPAYVTDQPPFLNAALLGRTELSPMQLLWSLKQVEKRAGRDVHGGQRWGPRPLDLDVIFFGNTTLQHETLTLPHPRWQERAFVKAPLADLKTSIPDSGEPAAAHTDDTSAASWLRRAHQLWQQDGGETQVGRPGLHRVLPVRRRQWRLKTRTFLMGILNVTPDSFSDGGLAGSTREALERVRQLWHAGADVIDIGGQSTRPGATRLSSQEELTRVMPVLRAVRSDYELCDVPISIDTFYHHVARECVQQGADMINDVSGGTLDSMMLEEVAKLNVPYVIMHMRGDPATMQSPDNVRYNCVTTEVAQHLQARGEAAIAAGVLPWNIVLDPGIGFAKQMDANIQLLAELSEFREKHLQHSLARAPLLLGVSRKGFLGRLTGKADPLQRDAASVAACTIGVAGGADIVRVHNVEMIADGVKVADAIYRRDFRT